MSSDVILKNISSAIRGQDPSAQAYLFGSRARGDHKLNSDWDILILVKNKKVTNEIEDKFRDVLYNIELESGQIISTFIYSKEYWNKKLKLSPLYESINKEGIKI